MPSPPSSLHVERSDDEESVEDEESGEEERASSPVPPGSWLYDTYLRIKPDNYERIAMASPRVGLAVIGYNLVPYYICSLPWLESAADFVPVCRLGRRLYETVPSFAAKFAGVRPKLATWPLLKRDAERNKVWNV